MELGLRLFKQLSSELGLTLKAAYPPDPIPRLSPATIINLVSPVIDAVHENPVPSGD